MLKSKNWALLSGFMLVSLIVTACQGQEVQVPVTVVVRETQQVGVVQTQIVTQTQIAEQTALVAAGPPASTRPHPILRDLRVRQAVSYGSSRPEMIASVYDYVDDASTLLMDTNIPSDHWAHADGVMQYEFDPEAGMALLEEAGWTDPNETGVRAN